MPHFMYVAVQEDDKILVFSVDSQTGKLTPQADVAVAGGPFTLAISPDRKYLYAGCREIPQLFSYQIDQANGSFDAKTGPVSLEANPTYIATDRKGKFCAVGLLPRARTFGVHPIGDDGSVGGEPIEWLETATGAHAMQTDPTNSYAFVPTHRGQRTQRHLSIQVR